MMADLAGISLDPTISLGQIASACVFLITLVVGWATLRSKVNALADEMVTVRETLSKLAETTIGLARVEERLKALDENDRRIEQRERDRERARLRRMIRDDDKDNVED